MLKLRGGFSENPRLVPLLDGMVTPKDIEIEWELGTAGAMFERHLRDNAFDVFEFSISDYIITQEKDPQRWSWTGIPIYFSRAFLGLNTWVNVNAGIQDAADLRGKRFGLADYTMTAGVWFRAMLDALYGIRTQDMSWFNGRTAEHSHGSLMGTSADPPPGIDITWLDRAEAVNEMIHAGEIDACFPADGLPLDTSRPTIRRLFNDGGRRFVESFYRATGFTPVNHTVLVQRRVIEENPWVPEALFEAFERAKQTAYRRDPAARSLFRDADDLAWQESIFGPDPYISGLSTNRAMLTMGAQQSVKDGLTRTPANVDELYWESVRGT